MISFNNGLGVIRNVLKIISSGFFSSERLLESVLKNMGLNANHFIDNSLISTNQ